MVESTTSLKNISTLSGRHYAPLLKCFQLEMKPQRARNKTALHSPGNRDVPCGTGVKVYVHISVLTSTTGQMSWKQSAYQQKHFTVHPSSLKITFLRFERLFFIHVRSQTQSINDTCLSSLFIYLFQMSSSSSEWREVDSVVPVHLHLNLFIKLEDHHGVMQISALRHTHIHTGM